MLGIRSASLVLGTAWSVLLGGVPAAAIECNQKVVDSIDVAGESDTHTFFAQAGERISIFRGPRGPVTDQIVMHLYAPDGSEVPLGVQVAGPLPQTGTYALIIWMSGEATGGYELTIVANQLGGALCNPFPLMRCGETISEVLEPGEWTFRSFAADRHDVVSVSAAAIPTIVAPDGSNERTVEYTASLAGRHTIGVRGGSGLGGPLHLTLSTLTGSINGGSDLPPTPICGAVADGTRKIGCGETKSGAIDVPGDQDLYAFYAKRGDQVRVQVAPEAGTTFWAVARIVPVGSAGFSHDGTVTIPANGGYAIQVTAGTGNQQDAGSYAVTLTRTPCASACNDGVDNDGDALVDLAQDPGCTSSDDLSEQPECTDGRDNDNDKATDYGQRDPGCTNGQGPSEDPACNDGADNDGDGTIDADGGGIGAPDAFCAGSPTMNAEAPPPVGCGLGPELALLLPALVALRRRGR